MNLMHAARQLGVVLILAVIVLPTEGQEVKAAQANWFPAQMQQGLIDHLSGKLVELALIPDGPEPQSVATRVNGLVTEMIANIDHLGLQGLRQEAPAFTVFDLPTVQNPLLALLNTYGMCTLPLHLELAVDDDQRLYVVVGEVAVSLITLYLRHQYLAGGGTDLEIKTSMTAEAITKLSRDVQVEANLRDHVSMACSPVLAQVMKEANKG